MDTEVGLMIPVYVFPVALFKNIDPFPPLLERSAQKAKVTIFPFKTDVLAVERVSD